jgi:hypothetical protein
MDDGSQYHVQIMENQHRFDLNDALLRLRRDLAGQPGIAAEDVRELEIHLLESLSAFQRRGLSEEEAFAKAREKLGSADEVGAEFAKAHRLRIWRDRVFWISFLGFLMALYSSAAWQPLMRLARWLQGSLGTSCAVIVVSVLAGLPGLLLSALLTSGYAEILYRRCFWLFSQRWRLGSVGVVAAVAANLLSYRTTGALFVYELGFLGFAMLVMPREIRSASSDLKNSGLEDWRNSLGVWRDRLFWVLLAHLAIGVWTTVTVAGANAYLLRLTESQRAAFPVIVTVLFFLIWLGPMGVVGLGLWTGHLSAISRALHSRCQVALIAGGLALLSVGTKFWLSTWNVSSAHFSAADWKFESRLDTLCTLLIGAVFVAVMVWVVPWQRHLRAIQ